MALPFLDLLPAGEAAGFARAVTGVASRLGVQAAWLMIVMERESKLKPTARNGQSGATGLIQFTRPAAIEAGTTLDALYRMSATQQLVYVERYYRNRIAERKRSPQSVYDLYMLTLSPASMGKPTTAVVFAQKTKAYYQNKPLDYDRKGYVTVADVNRFVDASGWQAAAIRETTGAVSLGALLFAGTLTYLAYRYYETPNH